MATVTPYPLDFDALEKGTVISRGELETIFGFCEIDDIRNWNFKVMGLVALIIQKTNIICRSSKGSIILMADSDANDYNLGTHKKAMKLQILSQSRLALIDLDNLTPEELARFESNARIITGTTQAMLSANKLAAKHEKLVARL